MNDLSQRVQYVVESFLENEALTDNLRDEAAQILLDWGIARGREIAEATAGMDDVEAEEAMYPQLRALRKLMRRINAWAPRRTKMAPEDGAALLDDVIAQAETAYGETFTPPAPPARAAFVQRSHNFPNDAAFIAALQELIEGDPQTGDNDEPTPCFRPYHFE
jgi:hypothetical protein